MANMLITGASGFLGAHVLREALSQGHKVSVLLRDAARLEPEFIGRVQVHPGDVLVPDSLRAALQEPVDVLFHVAASTNMWSRRNEEQMRINVGGMENLLAAARGKVGRFIATSSVAVYGITDALITEDSPLLALDQSINYSRSKALAQQRALASGLDVVMLNPTHIFGPGDRHNWARMIGMIDQNRLPGVPPGAGNFVDVRQVARAHLRAVEHAKAGECYLLGGEHSSFLNLVQLIAKTLGKKPPARSTPAALVKLLAQLKQWIARFTDVEPDLTPEGAAMVTHAMRVDISKAQRELGLQATPLPQLIADTVSWLRSQGLLSK